MKKVILGIILGWVLVPVGTLIYFKAGMVPVATAAPPMPFERTLARIGLSTAIDKEAPKSAPFTPDEQAYLAGAQSYRQNCAVCHGLPQQSPTAIAKGMYPRPPQLFTGHGVTDDPPGETYWKVANGIRLTGMPGFKPSLSEAEMWQVSLLLANADKLPAPVQQALTAASEVSPSPTTGK